jgi:hypothetical protein
MKRNSRYDLSEISLGRIISAIKTRLNELPHTFKWRFSNQAENNRQKIRSLKDTHYGERCFIVANGPSLARTDLNLIKNEISFGLNRIYLNFNTSSFRPTYYLALNELVLEQFSSDINQLSMPKFINWNQRSHYTNIDNTYYLKSKMVIRDFFQPDITKPVVIGASVTFAALQLAYYMGFHQVILVGLDHKYLEKGSPNQTEIRTTELDQSHFHPQYFPKGIKWQIPDLRRSEFDFELSRIFFEAKGREILDATIDGNCTVFKKVNYMSLFK